MKSLDNPFNFFSEDEPYMSASQLAYFQAKLSIHRDDVILKLSSCRRKLQQLQSGDPDILDRSNAFVSMEQEIKASERYSQYLKNIDRALSRIQEGTFGFCLITGDEIGLRRLDAQPWATLSIQALEDLEKNLHNRHELSLSMGGLY